MKYNPIMEKLDLPAKEELLHYKKTLFGKWVRRS